MKNSKICPKCQSTDIIPEVAIPDRYEGPLAMDLQLKVAETPDAVIFKNVQASPLRAQICGACGFVEMYVKDPGVLWRAYRKARKSGG